MRSAGYYWTRFRNQEEVCIAYFDGSRWQFCGDDRIYYDPIPDRQSSEDVIVVDETPIERTL